MTPTLVRAAALALAAALLAGCQTDMPLVDLKERYGPPPSQFLPMDGIQVHWRDEGPRAVDRHGAVARAGAADPKAPEPPAVLLLHGAASSLHTWDGWVQRMSGQFRVVRLDLPGFGLTGPHPSGDYSAAATVDFLERFADAAGLERFAIVGNSLGGYYAWHFALRHPERIKALVLIDSAGFQVEHSGSSAMALRLARTPVVSELMRYAPIEGAVRRSLREVYGDPAKVTPGLVERYAELMRRPGNRAAFGDRSRTAPQPTGWERVHQIAVPTLILWGQRDPWIPVADGERFQRSIAGSRLIVYPELGHLPMEEDPERTSRDAIDFLRSTVGPK